MKRRELLGTLGAGAAGMAALTSFSTASAVAQQDAAHHAAHHGDPTHDACMKACSDCALACDETFHHCYMQVAEGKKDHAKPLHLVSDCAGFCTLSASMVAKRSPLMAHSCASCAAACASTATEVEKFDSPEMKRAAKALRACEKSCREMVKSMGGHEHHETSGK